MLDVAVSYNRFKFIGHEFLTWLWFIMEERRDELNKLKGNYPFYLEIGNGLVVENMTNDAVEKITIKGDDAGLEEGMMALANFSIFATMLLEVRSTAVAMLLAKSVPGMVGGFTA